MVRCKDVCIFESDVSFDARLLAVRGAAVAAADVGRSLFPSAVQTILLAGSVVLHVVEPTLVQRLQITVARIDAI